MIDLVDLRPASIDLADPESFTFCTKKNIKLITATKAKVIFCPRGEAIPPTNKILIRVDNPRLAFIEAIKSYKGVETTPIIDPSAMIEPDVVIEPNVTIGKNVMIKSGSTIGTKEAFAYERKENGELIRFPHFGGVVIDDEVDIHVHVNIDRGTFGIHPHRPQQRDREALSDRRKGVYRR
jgi:UDP-3-O-[3-hydroxymyristoyl] glucosamine N-acyltransferase